MTGKGWLVAEKMNRMYVSPTGKFTPQAAELVGVVKVRTVPSAGRTWLASLMHSSSLTAQKKGENKGRDKAK